MQDKSIFFRIPKTGKQAFLVQHDNQPWFYDRLHYHPELQLSYIISGSGDLFLNDSIIPFEEGNLFLIGPDQSHLFKSDERYFNAENELRSRAVTIFFHENSLGEGFFNIAEMSSVRHLIERSGRGIRFDPEISVRLGKKLAGFSETSDFDQFQEMLSILNELASSQNYEYLSAVSTPDPLTDNENRRVNDVITYIFSNYKRDIKLKEVALIANYSPAAFCHFFKQRTRKTFTQFLNEVRVSQACKLLRNTDLNVSQICYDSGFNNVSNFNRQFKKVTGLSPTAYLKKYTGSLQPK
ncbi:MAG: AraC family transcriptional regulator [Balneolaceae bacterium]